MVNKSRDLSNMRETSPFRCKEKSKKEKGKRKQTEMLTIKYRQTEK